MGKFNKDKALKLIPKEFITGFVHKLDKRYAWVEGAFAVWLAFQTRSLKLGTKNEDLAGIDVWDDDDGVDIKGRKDCPPNTMYIETAKAGQPNTETGWVHADKFIYSLMVYSENNIITNIKFGKVHCNDLVTVIKEKVDFNSNSWKDTVYKIYHRMWEGQHRGDTTLITYNDVESCPSFESVQLPKQFWEHVRDVYTYDGVK